MGKEIYNIINDMADIMAQLSRQKFNIFIMN